LLLGSESGDQMTEGYDETSPAVLIAWQSTECGSKTTSTAGKGMASHGEIQKFDSEVNLQIRTSAGCEAAQMSKKLALPSDSSHDWYCHTKLHGIYPLTFVKFCQPLMACESNYVQLFLVLPGRVISWKKTRPGSVLNHMPRKDAAPMRINTHMRSQGFKR